MTATVLRSPGGGRVDTHPQLMHVVDQQPSAARSDGDDDSVRQHNTADTDGEQHNHYDKDNASQRSVHNNKPTASRSTANVQVNSPGIADESTDSMLHL